jgi:hypothetical protein
MWIVILIVLGLYVASGLIRNIIDIFDFFIRDDKDDEPKNRKHKLEE